MPKILLASAKWYHITAAESWAGGGKAAVKQAGMDMNSFNCIINRGQICSCQLYVMKKLGEGAEQGIQKPASCPWNVSLGMLNTRRAVICQGLSSGAEWKMRCCERAGRASLLRKFWSGSLQTQRKVNINSLFHETWQLTCKFLMYLGATQSGVITLRKTSIFRIVLIWGTSAWAHQKDWPGEVVSLSEALRFFKASPGCRQEVNSGLFEKAYSEILRFSEIAALFRLVTKC